MQNDYLRKTPGSNTLRRGHHLHKISYPADQKSKVMPRPQKHLSMPPTFGQDEEEASRRNEEEPTSRDGEENPRPTANDSNALSLLVNMRRFPVTLVPPPLLPWLQTSSLRHDEEDERDFIIRVISSAMELLNETDFEAEDEVDAEEGDESDAAANSNSVTKSNGYTNQRRGPDVA